MKFKKIDNAKEVKVTLQAGGVVVEVDGKEELLVLIHSFQGRPVVLYDERPKKDPVLVTTPKNTARGFEPIYDSNNSVEPKI